MKALHLVEVSKAFGRFFALHRVSLSFEPGTITVILGGNGAGKTTLMNLIATLESPTSGEIQFGDWDAQLFARKGRRNIGWVSHDSLLYPELTGRENLLFYANMYGIEDPKGTAESWLNRVRLTEFGDARVHTYSRGMRQRLSIARAMIHTPPIILLDEPMTGLDLASRLAMFDVFAEARDRGHIIILITHDFDFPEDFVDRVAILDRGKLVLSQPFTQGMNLIQVFRDSVR